MTSTLLASTTRPRATQLLGLICLLASVASVASDLGRESRIVAELSDGIIEGESIFLAMDKQSFWGILTESQGQPRGAIVILHGRGLNPNTSSVVRPLRTGLPMHGWTTLAIQLPVLAKSAEFSDYANILTEGGPRIEAGIRYLRERGYQKVHLIAHSCGGQMTMKWLDHGGGDTIDSLTVVSLGMTNYEQSFGRFPPLERVKVPILDIYGAQDFVAKQAEQRLTMIRYAGHPASAQHEIPGAKHMFKAHGAELVEVVATWLDGLLEK